MLKKEVEINFSEGEGEDKLDIEGKVTIKRLDYSEKNYVNEKAIEVMVYGETQQVKMSSAKMKEHSLEKSIISSTLKKTTYWLDKTKGQLMPSTEPIKLVNNIDEIRKLPCEIGDQLFSIYSELNVLSPKKKED